MKNQKTSRWRKWLAAAEREHEELANELQNGMVREAWLAELLLANMRRIETLKKILGEKSCDK